MKERADKLLVELGFAKTRSQAKLLIQNGVVTFRSNIVTKSGEMVDAEGLVVTEEQKYVGRGGYKLEGALDSFSQSVKGLVVADVGASTGGFTNVLLNSGVKKVFAIDVGTDQLHQEILGDDRVINLERTNIREIDWHYELVDGAVVDLSYISLKLVLKKIFEIVRMGGFIIALYKPQFEVGKDNIGKNGIVKDEAIRKKVLKDFLIWCQSEKYYFAGIINSPITGKDGNVEYFINFIKTDRPPDLSLDILPEM